MGITSPRLGGGGAETEAEAEKSRGCEVGEEREEKGGKRGKKGWEVGVLRKQESIIKH